MSRLMMKLMGRLAPMNEAEAAGGGGGEGSSSDPGAASAGAAAASETSLLGQQPAAATDPAAASTEQTPEQKAAAEAEAKRLADEKAANSAPETYADFTLPEGYEMDAGTLEAFKGLAKELNISQASAQKLIDMQTSLSAKQAEAQQAAVVKQSQDWVNQVKADPEIGGENFNGSIANAVKVVQFINDPQLQALLNDTGLGNHPALVKAFAKIGKAMSDDTFVMPGNQSNKPQQRDADVLFGDLNL